MATDRIRVILLVLLIVFMLAGWVLATVLFVRARADASRIADLEATNKELRDGNIALRESVDRFERERSEIYRRFEEAIGGAKGAALDALKTVDRIIELSKEIGN